MIENHHLKFALCGSSVRKLKRGHANLLGGRALRRELFGLTAYELGSDFDLEKILNRGFIPNHFMNADYLDRLRSYCSDYSQILSRLNFQALRAMLAFLHQQLNLILKF